MFSSKSEGKMDTKPRSRANTVIGQIKWWSSSNQPFQTNDTNAPPVNNNNQIKSFGSSVAVQKLRESKWFGPDESRIFCAVIECGFVVETREGQENDGWFGVVVCKTSKGKHSNGFVVDVRFVLFFFFVHHFSLVFLFPFLHETRNPNSCHSRRKKNTEIFQPKRNFVFVCVYPKCIRMGWEQQQKNVFFRFGPYAHKKRFKFNNIHVVQRIIDSNWNFSIDLFELFSL